MFKDTMFKAVSLPVSYIMPAAYTVILLFRLHSPTPPLLPQQLFETNGSEIDVISGVVRGRRSRRRRRRG